MIISSQSSPVLHSLARWDYHATHVNQLLTLATLEEGAQAHQLR